MGTEDSTPTDAPSAQEKWLADCGYRERELRLAELEGQRKAEQARILEMIKTGDPETAASNLDFLLKAGLISSGPQHRKLEDYLKNRVKGAGPVLPSAGDGVAQRGVGTLRVTVFHCESLGAEGRARAERIAALRASKGGSWTVQPLSEATNRTEAYRIRDDQIRYNADEQGAATEVQEAIRLSFGTEFAAKLALNNTRGYLSVFVCQGAPEILAEDPGPDAGNMAY